MLFESAGVVDDVAAGVEHAARLDEPVEDMPISRVEQAEEHGARHPRVAHERDVGRMEAVDKDAQAITLRAQRGQGDTEDMRKAVVHYRALFQELLEVAPPQPMQGKPVEARS